MRPPEMESPAVQGGAFAWVFSCAAERPSNNPARPAEQCLPRLIERHLGREFLSAWVEGGA